MEPQEYIIWRSTVRESYIRSATGLFVVLGLVVGAIGSAEGGILGFIVGFLLFGGLGIAGYVLTRKYNDYVVTNKRAMLRRFGKVVKEVPLNTPNLVISTGHGETIADRYTGVYSNVDIVFVANGIELLRFKKVDAGMANELFAKLKSLGFNVA